MRLDSTRGAVFLLLILSATSCNAFKFRDEKPESDASISGQESSQLPVEGEEEVKFGELEGEAGQGEIREERKVKGKRRRLIIRSLIVATLEHIHPPEQFSPASLGCGEFFLPPRLLYSRRTKSVQREDLVFYLTITQNRRSLFFLKFGRA